MPDPPNAADAATPHVATREGGPGPGNRSVWTAAAAAGVRARGGGRRTDGRSVGPPSAVSPVLPARRSRSLLVIAPRPRATPADALQALRSRAPQSRPRARRRGIGSRLLLLLLRRRVGDPRVAALPPASPPAGRSRLGRQPMRSQPPPPPPSAPAPSLMQALAAAACALFRPRPQAWSARDVAALQSLIGRLLSRVRRSHLRLRRPRGPVEYYAVLDDPAVTIGVFVLRAGVSMPIHDHPGMTVFSQIVTGGTRLATYTTPRLPAPAGVDRASGSGNSRLPSWTPAPPPPPPPPPRHPRPALATVYDRVDVHHPMALAVIRPDAQHTIHTYTAQPIRQVVSSRSRDDGDGDDDETNTDFAAFIDVIGPPYGPGRPCTYFVERPLPPAMRASAFAQLQRSDPSGTAAAAADGSWETAPSSPASSPASSPRPAARLDVQERLCLLQPCADLDYECHEVPYTGDAIDTAALPSGHADLARVRAYVAPWLAPEPACHRAADRGLRI
ncbi:hypothetical protein CXG81DRAFT_19820 [Caulochytrium protostelioides]|uniref:Uncharacterized protein n=1 Tax=Caulochytrium protostelioides TaxID=1555241 RepID=A0A4P9X533_9FUNG|nr:hypothetical protein CXG81DRAFT_19820 [Caulochytrium protostelioides]|eukprot:RKP00195.1 hypothetical protein CXG81DRAFT_19820 [Caulochytrium protostelioides]